MKRISRVIRAFAETASAWAPLQTLPGMAGIVFATIAFTMWFGFAAGFLTLSLFMLRLDSRL